MKQVVRILFLPAFVFILVCSSYVFAGDEDKADIQKSVGPEKVVKNTGPGKPLAKPQSKWWKIPEVIKDLDLTKKEQKKLDELDFINRKTIDKNNSSISKSRGELKKNLDSKKLDVKAAKSKFNEIMDSRKFISTARFEFMLSVRNLLGYERHEKLKKKMATLGSNRSLSGRQRPDFKRRGP